MQFIGVIGFDNHGDKLESRETKPASFSAIAEWVSAVVEHYQGELRYNPDCEWREIRISVYVNDETLYTINATAIETIVLSNPYN